MLTCGAEATATTGRAPADNNAPPVAVGAPSLAASSSGPNTAASVKNVASAAIAAVSKETCSTEAMAEIAMQPAAERDDAGAGVEEQMSPPPPPTLVGMRPLQRIRMLTASRLLIALPLALPLSCA